MINVDGGRAESYSMLRRFFGWVKPRTIPAGLILLGVMVLAWSAFLRTQSTPLSATEAVLLVVLSSFFNIFGGAAFGRIGRADPKHARSSVRRLLTIGRTLTISEDRLTYAIQSGDPSRINAEASSAAMELRLLREHLADAIRDWNDVHPEALREVIYSERNEASYFDQRERAGG
jgi:hypothetical protein